MKRGFLNSKKAKDGSLYTAEPFAVAQKQLGDAEPGVVGSSKSKVTIPRFIFIFYNDLLYSSRGRCCGETSSLGTVCIGKPTVAQDDKVERTILCLPASQVNLS